jgi:predicted phosphodiesterase
MKPAIVAIVSDTHIGSTTALSLSEWDCDTGNINTDGTMIYQLYKSTIAQDWIYSCWLDYWEYVKKLAGKKYRIVSIHLGDIIDGFHQRYIQSISNIDDQRNMAVEILRPIVNMSDNFYIIRGTECHAGESAQNEVSIARELGVKALWEGIFNVNGITIDCAHHGRASKRAWSSSASSIAAEAIHDAVIDAPQRPIPRYVFRGHMHLIDDSGEKIPNTRAVCLPSWELRNALGYRLEAGKRSDIGGVIILPDGSLDLSKLRYFAAPGQRRIINA